MVLYIAVPPRHRNIYKPYNETPTMKGLIMNLADYDYQVWRKALHDLQIKIDNFDLDFWNAVTDDNGNIVDEDSFSKAEAKHQIERQKLVDELNAHYESTPSI